MPEICKIFAKQLRKKRKELNMTQKQLAQASGLHRTYIVDLEKGDTNISIKNLEKLAEALQEDYRKLLTNTK